MHDQSLAVKFRLTGFRLGLPLSPLVGLGEAPARPRLPSVGCGLFGLGLTRVG